jgi:hypothetical protein
MRAIGLALAVVTAAALAACGNPAERRSSGTTLIVLDRSIGGVRLREQRREVERLLGRGAVIHSEDQKPPEPRLHIEVVIYPNGLEVGYVSRSAEAPSHGRVAYLVTHAPRFRTPEGVHVSSTAAELHEIEGITCGNLLDQDCQHGGRVHNQPGTFFKLSGGPGAVVVRIAIAFSD